MNILIITQGVSIIVEPLVNSQYSIVGIVECDNPRSPKKRNIVKELISLFLHLFFKKYTNLMVYCSINKIPYYLLEKKDDNFKNWIKQVNPDLIVVYSMSFLLKKEIFSYPPFGTINIHPSFLPFYRGPNPIFWMYYLCDLEPGVTIHYIDEGEDTGDIIIQDKFHIELGEKLSLFDMKNHKLSLELLFKTLSKIQNGKVITKKNPKESNLRAKRLKKSEYTKLIDWENWPIERVWHFLRGNEHLIPLILKVKYRYKVQHMLKCEITNYELSKIYNENRKTFLICKEGKIFLKKPIFPEFFLNL
jgi:methionyl-tRNA formyltransferase